MNTKNQHLTSYLEEIYSRGRTMLLPALHFAQEIYGWIPEEAQEEISKALRVPLADVHGVIEFYTMLYNSPTSKNVVRICDGPACQLANGQSVLDSIEDKLGLQHGETDQDRSITYERVPCLGMCEHAPAGLHNLTPAGKIDPNNMEEFLSGALSHPVTEVHGNHRVTLSRIGKIDPTSHEDYENMGGFAGLRKAITMEPEQLIQFVESSKIRGRGGAQFPTGTKWRYTRAVDQPSDQKHIVVNADESEPGAFKDRVIMEADPYSIIEAAALAGYAVGAENGWIFVRGEYPIAYQRLELAINSARDKGFLGKNILGKEGFNFDIELRRGAGAYVCGEETALFEAIEGKRGFPRIKPPFPTTHGLFHQPTAINNVETLVAILSALNIGIDQWLDLGTDNSPGTKLFCMSGHIKNPGLYEVPFGITIQELINMAGGVPEGRSIKAVLLGGAAGVFIGPDQLSIPLTYEDTKAHNVPIGSGVVMVFDESADILQTLVSISHFFSHESCGKCFPCQLGTQRQVEILSDIAQNGNPPLGSKEGLLDLGYTMTATSLCGLGQTASGAILSAIKLWPELVE